MPWFRRGSKPKVDPQPTPNGAARRGRVPSDPFDAPTCVGCGRDLGDDPEDELDAEGPGRHLCGECNRARNFDAELEMRYWNGDL